MLMDWRPQLEMGNTSQRIDLWQPRSTGSSKIRNMEFYNDGLQYQKPIPRENRGELPAASSQAQGVVDAVRILEYLGEEFVGQGVNCRCRYSVPHYSGPNGPRTLAARGVLESALLSK